jgi:hypothetical protein
VHLPSLLQYGNREGSINDETLLLSYATPGFGATVRYDLLCHVGSRVDYTCYMYSFTVFSFTGRECVFNQLLLDLCATKLFGISYRNRALGLTVPRDQGERNGTGPQKSTAIYGIEYASQTCFMRFCYSEATCPRCCPLAAVSFT